MPDSEISSELDIETGSTVEAQPADNDIQSGAESAAKTGPESSEVTTSTSGEANEPSTEQSDSPTETMVGSREVAHHLDGIANSAENESVKSSEPGVEDGDGPASQQPSVAEVQASEPTTSQEVDSQEKGNSKPRAETGSTSELNFNAITSSNGQSSDEESRSGLEPNVESDEEEETAGGSTNESVIASNTEPTTRDIESEYTSTAEPSTTADSDESPNITTKIEPGSSDEPTVEDTDDVDHVAGTLTGTSEVTDDISKGIEENDLITEKISVEEIQAKLGRDSLWAEHPFQRGRDFEILEEAHPAGNFPIIDDIDDEEGLGTSLKTIDLNAKSYQDISTLKSTLTRYIDQADFEGTLRGTVGGERYSVSREDLEGVALTLGVPENIVQPEQLNALREAYEYAQSKGINLTIKEVP